MDPTEPVQDDRVLSLSMRPRAFSELVGQDAMLASLEAQFSSGRVPHFFIMAGPVGCGKTTLARLVALALQCPDVNAFAEPAGGGGGGGRLPWAQYRRLDIREINAANKNGVDDARELIETMRFVPIAPSRAKVVILDEAHQLSTAAQNALLTETEDVSKHVYYIFSTSQPNKLLPALRRRAYVVTPKLLDMDATRRLVAEAARRAGYDASASASAALEPLVDALDLHDVRSPGLILQAAERFFSGVPALDSVLASSGADPELDTMQACRALAKGDWPACAKLLKSATKQDVYALRACMLGYLRTVLLNSTGAKAVVAARRISALAGTTSAIDDSGLLPAFLAGVCSACHCAAT